MCSEYRQPVPQEVYYPFSDKRPMIMWIEVVVLMLLGTLIAWAGRLGPGAYAASWSAPLVWAPFDIFWRAYRNRRRRAYEKGDVLEGVVTKKTALPMGPIQQLTVEYSFQGYRYRTPSSVPLEQWLPCRIGDEVRIRVASEAPRCWVLCLTGAGEHTSGSTGEKVSAGEKVRKHG